MNMSPDLINGLYEAFGGLFVLNHSRALWRSRQPWGVSILSLLFFFSWGCWNLFYYPHLHQWYSFFGGLFIVLTNCWYIGMLIYLRAESTAYWEDFFERILRLYPKRRYRGGRGSRNI